MITRLRIKGWKSHLSTELELTKGTNVLVGIMGSGKSSVLQAISFALFGEIPEVRSRELKLDGLIMRKPRRLEQAEVEMEFSLGDTIYKVNRTLGRDASARLYKEGSLLEHGSKRVSNKITELLGIDYDNFNSVVYSRQNQLDQFLQLGKTDRVKLIDRILKIDLIEKARKDLLSIKKSVSGELSQLEQLAKKDTTELKKELREKQEEKVRIEKELAVLKEQTAKEKAKLEKLRERLYQLDKKNQEKQRIEREISSFSGKMEQLEKKIKELPKLDEPEKKMDEIEKTIKETERLFEKLSNEITRLRTEKSQLEERLAEIAKSEKLAVTEVKDHTEQIQELRKKLAGQEASQDEHRRAIAELEKAGASCPVCGSELKDRQAHITRHEKVLAELKKEIEKTSSELVNLESAQKQNEQMMRDIAIAKKMIEGKKQLEKQLESIKIEPLNKEKEKKKLELAKLKEKQDKVRKAVERQEIDSELSGIKIKLEKLGSDKREVKYDKEEHIKVSESFDESNRLFSSFSERGNHLPVRIDDLRTIITKTDQEIAEIEGAKQKLDKKKAVFGSLSVLHNALREVQVVVREHFVELVNSSLGEVWSQLYPYRDYLGLRIFISREGMKEGDYVLQLREPAGWVNVEGIASGGERSMAALALRVALARAMTDAGLLLLDEPTHNLDKNGMDKLIQVLRDGMPNVLEQVVLITHDEEMEKAATGFAYKFERQKELEEPTRIVKV